MELDSKLLPEIDLQTETMLPIHIDTVCRPLENTNVKQEPDFHMDGHCTRLTENTKHVDDIANTFVVKKKVTSNDYYRDMDRQYDQEIGSNSKYIGTGMIRDIQFHADHVKSELQPLETNHRNTFIIEVDTCKDEYYETYHNNHTYINLEEDGVGHESGEDCVVKKDTMYMKHNDAQHRGWALYTSVDVKSCTVVLRDIQYTYPDIVTQGSVNVHDREPTILLHVQSAEYIHASQQSKQKPRHRCSVCGVGIAKKGNMDTHVMIHAGENPHKCSLCDAIFREKGHLRAHTRTHTREKPHTCTVCGDGFTKPDGLKRRTMTHTGEKHHTCSLCEVSFREKGHLRAHMRTHTGEKLYTCSFCGVGFVHASGLKYHTAVHTGEKPHTCSVCEVSFRRKDHLTHHMRTHTGEKPHKCAVCEVSFPRKGTLTSHMRTHTGEKPYECPVCGIAFGQLNSLRYHETVHTGEKPHICTVCGTGFKQKCDLTTHTRTHTGEKPHKCSVCDVSFRQKVTLTAHMRTHTGDKPY